MNKEDYAKLLVEHIIAAAAALESARIHACLEALRKATATAQTLERMAAGADVPRRKK